MSKEAGRFETSTKTKITTEHGTVLKVTVYNDEGYIEDNYKIKPKCSVCGEGIECLCYDSLETAIDNLKREWVCCNANCIVKDTKKSNPNYYEELARKFGDDIDSIADEIRENWPELGEGELCGI